jgi:hypothetical protein
MILRGISFLVGALIGAALLLLGLYLFPFAHAGRTERVMPAFEKSASHIELFRLLLGGENSGDVVSITTSGDPAIFPNAPAGTEFLQEPNIRDGLALITLVRNADDKIVGFATELEAGHENSSLLKGKVMTHTTWTVIVPGRGALFLYQTEDNWILFKRFVLPALLFDKRWQGSWKNLNTLGPSPEGYGQIIAATGAFAGQAQHFIEYAELRKFHAGVDVGGTMDLYVAFSN